VVKRISTPSWVLFSGGWCCLLITGFYLIADRFKQSWLTFPLQVVGMNSIFMYVTSHLWDGFFRDNLRTHLGKTFWVDQFGVVAPAVEGAAVLSIFWAMCWWNETRRDEQGFPWREDAFSADVRRDRVGPGARVRGVVGADRRGRGARCQDPGALRDALPELSLHREAQGRPRP
jgi:hypothetical protein